MNTGEESTDLFESGPHHAARPMRVVVDDHGCQWLCDEPVDETAGFEEQGCWRHVDMPFTRND
jgi:hypothetical protein